MNKRISILAASIILVACGGDDSSEIVINPVAPATPAAGEVSRIAFNPSDGVLPLPNDLLFAGTVDGTLEMPGETEDKEAERAVDLGDPGTALGGADGWSTQMPMQITVELADGATLDAASVGPASVLMVETDCGLGGTGCTTFTPVPYGPGGYVAVPGDGTIAVVPAGPLKPKTNYIVAITNALLDSRGEAVQPSLFYAEVTQDPADQDLLNDTLGAIQDATNGYEGIVFAATGTLPSDMIFTASWTTTSAGDAVVANAQAVLPSFTPTIVDLVPHPDFATTNDYNDALPGIADVYLGQITLPYFLGSSTLENPTGALTERFEALCDNGVLLAQADPAALALLPLGSNDTSCQALGLRDFGLDTERYVTQYNPVAQVKSVEPLEVILTVPNAFSGQSGPFPLVIYQHGITTSKETGMAFADSMAAAGYAVLGIDMPLHASRGFDLDGDGNDEVNASLDPTAFMNLAYLLTGRDNLRQSVIDLVGVRMALNGPLLFGETATISDADFDRSEIKFVGMSLGGMVGTEFVAVSAGLGMPLDSAALLVPGGGIVPLLFDSGSFGGLISTTVLEAAQAGAQAAGGDLDITDPVVQASVLGQFAFAAQTIIDDGDPNNFAASAAMALPIYLAQVNGDATIPNQSSFSGLTFGGTEPLASYMGLTQRVFGDAPAADGFVKFTEGSHGTFLSPEASATATTEMQTQVATFIAGEVVVITDAGVVE